MIAKPAILQEKVDVRAAPEAWDIAGSAVSSGASELLAPTVRVVNPQSLKAFEPEF